MSYASCTSFLRRQDEQPQPDLHVAFLNPSLADIPRTQRGTERSSARIVRLDAPNQPRATQGPGAATKPVHEGSSNARPSATWRDIDCRHVKGIFKTRHEPTRNAPAEPNIMAA